MKIINHSSTRKRLQIGVIGGREVSDACLQDAKEVGKLIAEHDAVLLCGGLGGVMEAACRGAKSANGLTVGILPVTDAKEANSFVDIVIPTGLGIARNAVIVQASNGVIAVGGKYGTLSEMAFALQTGIPVVSLKSWDVDEKVLKADTAGEAVELLFKQIRKKSPRSK